MLDFWAMLKSIIGKILALKAQILLEQSIVMYSANTLMA